jgi:hypothetical protein
MNNETAPAVKKVSDSTKIAYGEIEFEMKPNELLQTKTFKDKSDNDLKECYIEYSYVMKEKLKENHISRFTIVDEDIVLDYDVKSISTIEKIGLFEYTIDALFLNNSLFLVRMLFSGNDNLENIKTLSQ